MKDFDYAKFGISPISDSSKVCVRVGNSNFAEFNIKELPVVVDILIRLGFMCTIHKINND